jgi:CSLREA domain-containing protein
MIPCHRLYGYFCQAPLGLALLGVLLVAPAQAATLTVNSPADDIDVNPGDGMCATAGGLCTLRAALAESNALPGADQIILPPNLYALSLVDELLITDDLTITGGRIDDDYRRQPECAPEQPGLDYWRRHHGAHQWRHASERRHSGS